MKASEGPLWITKKNHISFSEHPVIARPAMPKMAPRLCKYVIYLDSILIILKQTTELSRDVSFHFVLSDPERDS